MAERVIEEIRGLPPAALREVCEAVNRLAAEVSPAPSAPEIRPRVSDQAEDDADEAAFFAALEEARRLWGQPGRGLPDLVQQAKSLRLCTFGPLRC